MHEYSIVSSLVELCEKEAKKSNAKAVKNITIQVGRLCGIETHFMKSCFDFFKEDTICHDATLVMKIIDVKIHCEECNCDYIIEKNNFFCPICNSKETRMIEGQEMIVESIEIY